MLQTKPRILVVTTRSWTGVEPFLRALEGAGFGVGLVHGQSGGHTLHDASVAMFLASPLQLRRTIERAMQDLSPNLVVPTDEPSFNHLRDIYARQTETGSRSASSFGKIIARSFGDPAAHGRINTSAELQRFAREHGLPVPNSVAVSDEATLRSLLQSVPLPVMLKGDGGWSGPRAEILRNVDAGIAAYHRATGVGQIAKRWKEQNTLNRLSDLLQPRQRTVFLQQHIDGVAAERSVACREGTVLAGVSVEPLESTGPALVAKLIRHRVMENIVAFVVKTLNLSGVVGFDFILEHGTRRAWLLAVKPYATSISQLVATGDVGLAEALFDGFAASGDRRFQNAGDGVVTPFRREAPWQLSAAARAHPLPPDHFAGPARGATGTDGPRMDHIRGRIRPAWARPQ